MSTFIGTDTPAESDLATPETGSIPPASWRTTLEDALLDPKTVAFRRTMRVLLGLIMLSMALIAAEGMGDLHERYASVFSALDTFLLVAFTVEYGANILVAKPRRKYVLGWWGLVDLAAILPFFLGLFHVGGLAILRELRVLRVLRILKLMKVARAARADSDEVWLPLTIFFTVAASAWVLNDAVARTGAEAIPYVAPVTSYATQIAIGIAGAYLVNRLMQVLVWEGLLTQSLGVPVPRLIRDVAATSVYGVAVATICAVVFRQPLTGMWAATGALSVVIGLALRNVILDLFMGLATQIDRPSKIGDYVMLQPGSVMGRVVEVHWRTTRIYTSENNTVVVPNSRIGEMLVTNFSVPDARAEFELVFTLDHAVPTERALRVLAAGAAAVAGSEGILDDPAPKARAKGTSSLGIEYKVKYWIDCAQVGPVKARHRVLTSVLDHLRQAGLGLAYAKQDVLFAPLPPRTADSPPLEVQVRHLRATEAFSALETADLESLARGMTRRAFREGEVVACQGAEGESLFVIAEGLAHVLVSTDRDGGPTRVASLLPGHSFGDLTLLTGEPYAATVAAASETVAYEVTLAQVRELFAAKPELIETLGHVLAEGSPAVGGDEAAAESEEPETPAARVVRRLQAAQAMRQRIERRVRQAPGYETALPADDVSQRAIASR
jgi:small-conductance mechanosensitive channel/CRP-like cAMP-binding protein